ncbi:MAG: DUF2178 domain-containing protein [Clostridia bacterium]|nr:DUF2178 domain-containing protein [Clostridia bacterium]
MEFRKKLKVRLYTAIAYIIIGAVFIGISFTRLGANEMISSFGAVFAVMGIARIVQYLRITKDEESIHQREIAETDERNVMIWTKARSLAFSIYILAAALAVVVLYLMNMNFAGKIVAYNLFGFVAVYWICYFIISRKY